MQSPNHPIFAQFYTRIEKLRAGYNAPSSKNAKYRNISLIKLRTYFSPSPYSRKGVWSGNVFQYTESI
jgi:hypothetical protein